jgi:hypothetical protein
MRTLGDILNSCKSLAAFFNGGYLDEPELFKASLADLASKQASFSGHATPDE